MSIVYEDPPDLIEVEAHIIIGEWLGMARGYTGPNSLADQARDLVAWVAHPHEEIALEVSNSRRASAS